MHKRSIREHGFTLVEISIVLVIIGLVTSGILLGRELIAVSRMRAAISQVERFNSASIAFKMKYNAIAGDMQHPENFFATAWNGDDGTLLAGNGDGIINMAASWVAFAGWGYGTNNERSNHFGLLQTAGLISEKYNIGEGTSVPGNCGDSYLPVGAMNGRVLLFTNTDTATSPVNNALVSTPDMKNYYIIGIRINWGDCSDLNSMGTMTPTESAMLDRKMDDGNALTGKVRVTTGDGAWPNVLYNPVPLVMRSIGYGLCNLNDDGSYGTDLLNGNPTGCNIRIEANW